MCSLETYKIDLKGLMEDERVLDFDLNDDFFQSLDGSQLEHGTLHVSVSIWTALSWNMEHCMCQCLYAR